MVKWLSPKSLVVFVGFLVIGTTGNAQIKDNLAFIVRVNPIDAGTKQESSHFSFKEVSEIKLISTGLIRLYQLFISTQDLSACNFTVSCSHYGMKSFQKYGVFYGILMTSDRIQRCNGIGKKYYPIDPQTGLAIDYPIETYYLGGPERKSKGKNSGN